MYPPVAAVALLACACGSASVPAGYSPAQPVGSPVVASTLNDPGYPVSPIGGTLTVWQPNSQSNAEYTVANPTATGDGHTRMDVTVTAHGTGNTVGQFSALTATTHQRVPQTPSQKDYTINPPTFIGLNWGGVMLDTETRAGFVDFPTTDITAIYLSTGSQSAPLASWTLK